jgi:hypothetical protein
MLLSDISQSDTPALDDDGNFRSVEEMKALGVEFLYSPSSSVLQTTLPEIPHIDLEPLESSEAAQKPTRTRKAVVREDPVSKLLAEKEAKKTAAVAAKQAKAIQKTAIKYPLAFGAFHSKDASGGPAQGMSSIKSAAHPPLPEHSPNAVADTSSRKKKKKGKDKNKRASFAGQGSCIVSHVSCN